MNFVSCQSWHFGVSECGALPGEGQWQGERGKFSKDLAHVQAYATLEKEKEFSMA